MTDRPRVNDDNALDADLERRLRAAFTTAALPEAPASVNAEVARLAVAPGVRRRPRVRGWSAPGWIVVVLAVSAILVGSLLSGGSSSAPSSPAPGSVDATAGVATPSPTAEASGACAVSPGTMHGTWWREIGGPNAYFNWEAEPRRLEPTAPWKTLIRFDPDAGPAQEVSVSAEHLASGERAVAVLNGRQDPSRIFYLDSPAPDLPGGWYLFLLPLPAAGCWRLSAAIDGQIVGTAVVEVDDAAHPSAPPNDAPTPEIEPTPWPVESMAPAADDVLPLAGRDGVPGMLYCANMPFAFDALAGPTGAEDAIGPEFDVLRSQILGDPIPLAGDLEPDATFREVARDRGHVLFLHERPGVSVEVGGRYIYVKAEHISTGWRWAGYGDCHPMAVWPPGYGRANWILDPAFRAPGPNSRTLHLLVTEETCSGGRSATGRISPAFVTWDAQLVVIELFVQTLPGDHECPGVPPTPATLRLPVPLGDRTLFDAGTIGQGGSGG